MRGGRKPNGWIGRPQRGKRSREHRLEFPLNGGYAGTDSRSEQRSEVVGSRLQKGTPNGHLRTGKRRCASPRIRSVGGFSRSLESQLTSVGRETS
jgi:hypothetical protein